jgi:hypothetical protein
MSDLTPLSADEFAVLSDQVRQHNSKKLYDLIAMLEPAALGFSGPINPGLVRVYREALRDLAQLWRAYDRPVVEQVEEEDARVPELAAEAARMEVLKM